jgi:hypothetical protein
MRLYCTTAVLNFKSRTLHITQNIMERKLIAFYYKYSFNIPHRLLDKTFHQIIRLKAEECNSTTRVGRKNLGVSGIAESV